MRKVLSILVTVALFTSGVVGSVAPSYTVEASGLPGDNVQNIGTQAPLSPTAAWPMFMHDLKHTGRSPYTGPASPGIIWSNPAPGNVNSPSIGPGGNIYYGCDSNKLYASRPDGVILWSSTGGGWIRSTPAIDADGRIYYGVQIGRLVVLEPNGANNIWYVTGGPVYSSPAVGSDGTIYFGSGDNKFYAFNPSPPYGSLKWSYTTLGTTGVDASPAIGTDGTIYVGSGDGDNSLYAFNPDGTVKWRFVTGGIVFSSPTIANDGTIYVGSRDDQLYAVNPDGTLKWSFNAGADVDSTAAIASDGVIYVSSNDGILYSLNSDGSLRWSYATGDIRGASAAIDAGNTIYIPSSDHKLYAINSDGTLKWTLDLGDTLSPNLAIGSDGTIYVGAGNQLYAIGTESNAPPVAQATVSPNVVEVNSPITFDGSGSSDPDGSIVAYEWDFGDGTTSTDVSGTHVYSASGVYEVSLTVTDNLGAQGVDSVTVVVNIPPVAQATVNLAPVAVNSPIPFDGSGSSDSDGSIVAYDWDFGDGTTSTDVSGTHAYSTSGVYQVSLTVTDNSGAQGVDSVLAVVYDPDAGFVTGGGHLIPGGSTSDPGDMLPGLDNTSAANCGFVVKYKKDSSTPSGQLEFNYNEGDFSLHSISMDWLIIVNNNWAKFRGTASVRGMSGVFPLHVECRDGDLDGGSEPDRFIIKIYAEGADPETTAPIYKASGDMVGGNIKIHMK